jgi:TolB-like protein/class 3 adenylate cyclase/Tfp pilus assembly protein PilF
MDSKRLPRKLAAVLYADVASYSRLMGEAEDATHRRLAGYLDCIAATVTRCGGRVVHYAGDAVLAKFEAATDALSCAADIQRELASRNSAQPSPLEFRIGLNLGDVIEDRGDIYGDGVNVAARLQALAEPGQICVSQSIRTAVGNRLPLVFKDIGEQRLKNIDGTVRAYAVRVTGPPDGARARSAKGRGLLGRTRLAYGTLAVLVLAAASTVTALLTLRNTAEARPVTVAVLPLANLSGDATQEYFADGMTEALITSLARLNSLSVISRTSVMRYKGTTKTVPEIARELGATAIVEGSAQLDGDQVRITAQLIDTATDRHLWADDYDREFQDVLRLQSEIARNIASEIDVTVSPNETRRLASARAVDPETYRAYLRGMYHLSKSTPEDLEQGIAYLHEAVGRDPGDALAQAGLALGYATLGHGPEPQADAWPRARAAALRAIALDPDLAEAHAALADVKLYMEWDWPGAEQAFLRANELNPSLAMNHYHHAWYLALFGRWDEAFAEHKRAQALDPLTPLHTLWLGGLYMYENRGRNDEAITEAERALELQPDNPSALLVLAWAHSAAGRHEFAIETAQRMVELNPTFTWELGLIYSLAGRETEARAILGEIEREQPTSWTAYGRAMLHAQFGELDAAFEALAYEPPHAWVPWVREDPWLRPRLEGDPRFAEMLARMKLPL